MPTPFEILGIEPAFELDLGALEKRHRDLSGTLHPDRYAGRPASERRMALDRAIQVNDAWRQLRDPVHRAEALLKHHGVAVGEGVEPKATPALLMQMMEVREELAEARQSKDADQVANLAKRLKQQQRDVMQQLAAAFREAAAGDPNALATALPLVGELRYFRRFFEEVDAIEEELLA